ncbi:phosphoribosylanthranilate isomerase [Euzebyella marina]|uniref:N-(5'-phosphoribosyl)anthranilate isomerase n=1 Tax=Euzebyella marina TaxID=1761453 RepID=A0A3G2L434_9FLAO|nr:phosphoribosylanthranilate isomerase [Euzebyella marina]AYN67018.1 phosphoribosylanthranilate isomerase [Euzebyella marina]
MNYFYTNPKEKPSTLSDTGHLKLKVCGMKHNPTEIASLSPDYLGFIFWEKSERYFKGSPPPLPHKIKKVGVFVDASITYILQKIEDYNLLLVQLHGNESPEFCHELKTKAKQIQIIKVFSIKDDFDFEKLEIFETVCDFYLFDTKGKLPGGNGYAFDWSVLNQYNSTKPYFLSGGIGLEELKSIQDFSKKPEAQYCHAIDINSRFESKPGLKVVDKVKTFKELLTKNEF